MLFRIVSNGTDPIYSGEKTREVELALSIDSPFFCQEKILENRPLSKPLRLRERLFSKQRQPFFNMRNPQLRKIKSPAIHYKRAFKKMNGLDIFMRNSVSHNFFILSGSDAANRSVSVPVFTRGESHDKIASSRIIAGRLSSGGSHSDRKRGGFPHPDRNARGRLLNP